jgi:hypothetical protein
MGSVRGSVWIKEGDASEAIEHSHIHQLNVVSLRKVLLDWMNTGDQFHGSTAALSNCASLQTLALFDMHKAHPSILLPRHLMSFIDEYEVHPQVIV